MIETECMKTQRFKCMYVNEGLGDLFPVLIRHAWPVKLRNGKWCDEGPIPMNMAFDLKHRYAEFPRSNVWADPDFQ